jgi:phage shock protein E
MLNFIKRLFKSEPPVDFKQLLSEGAVIIDVRSKGEYQGGHLRGSINIPLDKISANLNKLDKNKVIITCCASGMRSGSAKSILRSNGFEAHNGGGWMSLKNKVSG